MTPPPASPAPLLRIALPNKGRLAQDARDVFNDAGLEVRALSDRALKASLGGEFEAIFVRAQDIPEFVSDGAADAGVTGLDLVAESRRNITSRLDLGFGRCRLVVAARDDCAILSPGDIPPRSRVATAFPNIAAQYFFDAGQDVEIVPISGAAEIAPHLGIADVIVDLVSTGSTLKTNGLREIGTVMWSTAQLVTATDRTSWSDTKNGALEELATALESVISARGQRYLMANVPRARLDEVRAILPGLNGPTVIDVLDGGVHVAVHAVVPATGVYRAIAQLKSIGGEGILVTRIERLMK
ncbi:MAG: ATP phosphoribosyltransferase [Gemmatimonadota bacterium]|nr:ATP phosphoribosyltransferase [Gemmatimonadota bacterium]